jgi:hypothetical protein
MEAEMAGPVSVKFSTLFLESLSNSSRATSYTDGLSKLGMYSAEMRTYPKMNT